MQRIKIKFWRRSSRSIGDKPGSSVSPPPSSLSSTGDVGAGAGAGAGGAGEGAEAAFSVAEGTVDITPIVHCRLCLCDVPKTELYTMSDCKCTYCSKCCEQYIRVMISEGSVLNISCPDAFCPIGGQFRPTEIEKFTDKKTYARYRRLKFERDVELDPLRTFCPQVGCDTICHMKLHAVTANTNSPAKASPKAKAISCPTCQHVFCSMCKVKWHGGEVTCDDAMRNGRLEDQGIPFESSTDAEVKRCPLCHVPIERNDGCAQMMCKRCKHLFCWYCQESLNDDFLLRHYDKGPCKNKLGHTRASVLWHRAQVVGIFTGVGLLMLLASPFLLLAAPCILFCKCSPPQPGEEDDDDIMRPRLHVPPPPPPRDDATSST